MLRAVGAGAVASVLAVIGSVVPIRHASALLPDPGLPGPYSVTTTSYDFGNSFAIPNNVTDQPPMISGGFSQDVEVRAEVDYPTNLKAFKTPLPLVLILHGHHVPCWQPGTTDTFMEWPCSGTHEPIPSYEGFHYLAGALASYGFIVASVSDNGISAQDASGSVDNGALARAFLMEHHLDLWNQWNSGSAVPFGTTFVGHVDMSNVGLIGHSAGGAGVAQTVLYNESLGSPYGINALEVLAPGGIRPTITGVPLAVVQGYCDGNVPSLQAVHYYDDARYALPGDTAPKHLIVLMGGNHFYYDTVQTASPYPAGLPPIADDWSAIDPTESDGHCGTSSGHRLSDSDQRTVTAAYTNTFMQRYLKGDTKLTPYLTGDTPPPASVGSADIRLSYQPPDTPDDRLDINRYDQPSTLATNTLGGAVTSNLSPSLCGSTLDSCVSGSSFGQEPHTPGIGMMSVGWSGPGGYVRNELDGVRNVSNAVVEMRVGVNFTDVRNSSPPDFDVTLEDDSNQTASVPVSSSTQPIMLPPGATSPVPHMLLQTIRIPVSAFTGVNKARVRAVILTFDRASSGAIFVNDLAFTDAKTILAKKPPPFSATVALAAFPLRPGPHPPTTVRLRVPIIGPGDPVESAVASGPGFHATLLGSIQPASGECTAFCAVDVSFAADPASAPGTAVFGTLSLTYADGSTHSWILKGVVRR
jgi:hypothetical protein